MGGGILGHVSLVATRLHYAVALTTATLLRLMSPCLNRLVKFCEGRGGSECGLRGLCTTVVARSV